MVEELQFFEYWKLRSVLFVEEDKGASLLLSTDSFEELEKAVWKKTYTNSFSFLKQTSS